MLTRSPCIAVDTMGCDLGLEEVVAGAAALSLQGEGEILLVGDAERIRRSLDQLPHNSARLPIVASEGAIPMDAKARDALAAMPRASLPLATRMVASREADALVSAGNTGAVVLSCAQSFQRIPGVRRTALAAVYPTEQPHGRRGDPFSLMLDVGANIRVQAEDLEAFAIMGTAYAQLISDNPNPSVALLNNGTEAGKGPPELIEAYERLSCRSELHFLGNIEGLDIPKGTADVVVCDGFTGNIVLKMLEGVNETVRRLMRHAVKERLLWRMALLMLRSGLEQLKEITDWRQYGGAPILGFEQLCIKAHGRSTSRAIVNAIKVARKASSANLSKRIADQIASSGRT